MSFVSKLLLSFVAFLSKARIQHEKDPDSENLKATKPHLLRSLFIIGLLTKHFDLDKINETNKVSINIYCLVNSQENLVLECQLQIKVNNASIKLTTMLRWNPQVKQILL